ncbi:BCCT family transporter [Membranicola marinus]|uniref:BCCT family transporter n=1 Tax=Membranihabitans marinus TaxID=1227546 RepID=A0A953LAS3_9BACT|nr:BCCT family transporter [Membranihabitans marinus]MBY5960270.1 BCCT family transporter [Membranihabitans marinus]
MAKKIVRSDHVKNYFGLQVNPVVFFASVFLIFSSITLVLIYQKTSESMFLVVQSFIAEKTGWFFILVINVFIVFLLVIAFGKFGQLRIGGASATTEFSTLSWFAMLFSAGMGIGLLFWSVGEPITHFSNPPGIEGGTPEAAIKAMNLTFLHWGFHAWGVYALVGLSLAYFTYSRGLPLTIRSVFYPLFGDRIYGWPGDLIDIFAVLATLFGLATSLGFGAQQMAAGVEHLWGIDSGHGTQILLIIGVTLVAMVSVILGVDKGVKVLSEWNMRIALVLLILVVILGPTLFIFQAFVQNTGSYLFHFIETSTWTESYLQSNWQNDWTIFYWGWWIAWSPFVGMFIARISKGRTVREFILGVLILPSLVMFFWITAFGSTGIHQVLLGDEGLVRAVDSNVATALFVFLEQFPLAAVLNTVGILLIAGFFITSSDSGSLVIDSLTSGGQLDVPVGQRIFWALTEGAVAAVLLLGGGLSALQAATIATGLPFAIILLFICFSLYKALKEDMDHLEKQRSLKEKESYEDLVGEIVRRRQSSGMGKTNESTDQS